MDYFITVDEKSIKAIGDAVGESLPIVDELKEEIADLEEAIELKDARIAELERQLINAPKVIDKNIGVNIRNTANVAIFIGCNSPTVEDINCCYNVIRIDANSSGTLYLNKPIVNNNNEFVIIGAYPSTLSPVILYERGTQPTGVTIRQGGSGGSSSKRCVIKIDDTYTSGSINLTN